MKDVRKGFINAYHLYKMNTGRKLTDMDWSNLIEAAMEFGEEYSGTDHACLFRRIIVAVVEQIEMEQRHDIKN